MSEMNQVEVELESVVAEDGGAVIEAGGEAEAENGGSLVREEGVLEAGEVREASGAGAEEGGGVGKVRDEGLRVEGAGEAGVEGLRVEGGGVGVGVEEPRVEGAGEEEVVRVGGAEGGVGGTGLRGLLDRGTGGGGSGDDGAARVEAGGGLEVAGVLGGRINGGATVRLAGGALRFGTEREGVVGKMQKDWNEWIGRVLGCSPRPEGLEERLRPEQRRVLELMACGKRLTEAAREAGVSRTTVYNWMNRDETFVMEREWIEREMDVERNMVLKSLAGKAAAALERSFEAGDGKLAMRYFERLGRQGMVSVEEQKLEQAIREILEQGTELLNRCEKVIEKR